jgi:hypothetical protein
MTRVVNFCIILTQQQKEEKWGGKKKRTTKMFMYLIASHCGAIGRIYGRDFIYVLSTGVYFSFFFYIFSCCSCVCG